MLVKVFYFLARYITVVHTKQPPDWSVERHPDSCRYRQSEVFEYLLSFFQLTCRMSFPAFLSCLHCICQIKLKKPPPQTLQLLSLYSLEWQEFVVNTCTVMGAHCRLSAGIWPRLRLLSSLGDGFSNSACVPFLTLPY